MFGFLPSFWSVADTFWLWALTAASTAAWSGLLQQSPPASGHDSAAAVFGSAFRSESKRPLAAAHPPAAPAASATRTARFDIRNMRLLLRCEWGRIRHVGVRS